MRNGKKRPKECTCDKNDIFKCLCELDKEIDCIKDSFGHKKYFGRVAKEKVLFCILLREISNLDKKLDKILRELDCEWYAESDVDSNSDCDSEYD